MLSFLDKLPYGILIPAAILLLLAPFHPMPHALEKILMLKDGNLRRPIDIFDLCLHTLPTVLLLLKVLRQFALK